MPSDSMAAFLVFSRVTEISPHHFEARVFVGPAGEGEDEPALAARCECRIFESAELATTEAAHMAEAMTNRLATSSGSAGTP
jgi:hypothetical protein